MFKILSIYQARNGSIIMNLAITCEYLERAMELKWWQFIKRRKLNKWYDAKMAEYPQQG